MASSSGSYSVPKTLAACRDLNDGQKLLLTVIASLGTPEKPCNATHAQFAERVGHSRSTVTRWLDTLAVKGYLIRMPARLPIARRWAHWLYQLPTRVWRLFLRAWAMVGPKWRALSRRVRDWLEPRLPLDLLRTVPDHIPREAGPTKCPIQDLSPNTPVRLPQPAPGPCEQLSFAELLGDSLQKGLTFLSPERQAQVLAQAEGGL